MRTFSLLVLASSLGAYAGTISAVSTAFTGTDFIDWSVVETAKGTTTPASPLTSVTNLGVSFTISDLSGSFFLHNFGGLSGTDIDTRTSPGAMTLSFASPFGEVGFNLQVNAAFQTTYTADVQVFDSLNNLMGTEHYVSGSTAPIFIGLQSTATDIAKLVITPTFNAGASTPDWAIDTVQLAAAQTTSTTPEPGTFVLTGLGVIAAAMLLRRR